MYIKEDTECMDDRDYSEDYREQLQDMYDQWVADNFPGGELWGDIGGQAQVWESKS